MLEIIIKILGAIGLLLITSGVIYKKQQNWLFLFGGIALLSYSIYLKDPVFIPLQIIFIIASIYEIYKLKKSKT